MRVRQRELPPWLTPEIMQMMCHRNQLKRVNKQEVNKVNNKIKNMIRDSKRACFTKIAGNSKNVAQIWKAVNTLLRGSAPTSPNIPEHFTADTFNEYFLSVASTLTSKFSNDQTQTPYTSEKLSEFCSSMNSGKPTFEIPLIAVYELGRYISRLENKKSSGPDEISNKLLKLSLPYTVESLTYIFNLCIQKNTFPVAFKRAKVIPLPKSKITSDITNYRPISLLSVLSKLLERHVHTHLTSHMEARSLFHPLQSGFRSKHSCTTALSLLTDKWLSAMNNSELSGAVFLDLTKAFDTVNHQILLDKLALYLGGLSSIPFFKSYLEERTQRVYVHGSYSYEGTVSHGVPQGSVLGPLLFCIYINDLPFNVTDPAVECHLLADDTTLHTTGKQVHDLQKSLQTSLTDIASWCHQNHMALNPKKSNSMVITTRQKRQLSPPSLSLSVNDDPIKQVSSQSFWG